MKEPVPLYDEFQWAIPKAFRDALAKCRFEKGDILHADKIAYEKEWGVALQSLSCSIQLVSPSRAVNASTVDQGGSTFVNNWKSSVELELIDHQKKTTQDVTTCQGNLYCTAWKGDISYVQRSDPAPIPFLFSDVNTRLENFILSATSTLQFIYAVDQTSSDHHLKTEKLIKSFNGNSSITRFTPTEIGDFDGSEMLPTVQLILFSLDMDEAKAAQLIKDALYVPVKNKITDRERFRLRDHGLLNSLVNPKYLKRHASS
jgi:hypothetical protein